MQSAPEKKNRLRQKGKGGKRWGLTFKSQKGNSIKKEWEGKAEKARRHQGNGNGPRLVGRHKIVWGKKKLLQWGKGEYSDKKKNE